MRKKSYFFVICLVAILGITLAGCNPDVEPNMPNGSNYTIPQIDLSQRPEYASDSKYNDLYELVVVDDKKSYMAHPDSVLLPNGNIMTMYPAGHGRGAVLTKISTDGGKTWGERLDTTPKSWEKSQETPTVYQLDFKSGNRAFVMISANPSWGGRFGNIYGVGKQNGNGFNASISFDDCVTWSEFQTFYGYGEEGYVNPIVAMASLTRLKDENGDWKDEWMGFFHDYDFVNYKSILTVENGVMKWSKPEPYFADYRDVEKEAGMCEVEVVRSENGEGNQLCLLARSNSRKMNSLISFSNDEGKTWSEPKELPAALTGDRHKAEYLPDGRLFITFRSIERDPDKYLLYRDKKSADNYYSEGWIGWVGDYNDLINGTEGQYRVKIAHTYRNGQKNIEVGANADTGYCGNVVLADGTIVTSSYGQFGKKSWGKYTTYIASKRLNINLLDELVLQLK